MIRRRSLTKRRTGKVSKQKGRRSRKFGKKNSKKNKETSELSKDSVFNAASNFIKPHKIVEIFSYVNNLFNSTLNGIKPDENMNLNLKEKFQRMIIGWYKSGIKDFVKNMTPEQALLLSEGRYNKEISNKLLWRIDPPPVDGSQITGIKDNTKLLFLKSIFGKIVMNNIKRFFESLSPTQLVLLINGKYDIANAMYNSFLHTKYTTIKAKDVPMIEKQLTRESELEKTTTEKTEFSDYMQRKN